MSDDEKFVNDWKEYFTISGTFGDWPRLIALASIGVAVKRESGVREVTFKLDGSDDAAFEKFLDDNFRDPEPTP